MSDWLSLLSAKILSTFRSPETILNDWHADCGVKRTSVRVDADGNWHRLDAGDSSEENPALNVIITVKRSIIVGIAVRDDDNQHIAGFVFYSDGNLMDYNIKDWGQLTISDSHIRMQFVTSKMERVELEVNLHKGPDNSAIIWGPEEPTGPIPYEWLVGRSIVRNISPELVRLIPARVYGNGIPSKLRLYDKLHHNILIWPEFHYFAEKTPDGEIQTTTYYKHTPGTELVVDKWDRLTMGKMDGDQFTLKESSTRDDIITIVSAECGTQTEITYGKVTVTRYDGKKSDFILSQYYHGVLRQEGSINPLRTVRYDQEGRRHGLCIEDGASRVYNHGV